MSLPPDGGASARTEDATHRHRAAPADHPPADEV
jgi:hypothetical protein